MIMSCCEIYHCLSTGTKCLQWISNDCSKNGCYCTCGLIAKDRSKGGMIGSNDEVGLLVHGEIY